MDQANSKSIAQRKQEFLSYLSGVLNETERTKPKKVENLKNAETYKRTERPKEPESQKIMLKMRVFDKTKQKTKDFELPKEISIALMGSIRNSKCLSDLYFECEWSVFRWIQQWLLHQNQVELQPNLLQGLIEAASALDAPLLLTTCLQFWRGNVRYVMKDSEWESLNENVITQFANLFNNCSLEELDCSSLQESLYRQFITFLMEPIPRDEIGHFGTFSTLWRCKYCGKLMNEKTKSSECQFVAVNPKGDVGWAHSCDPDWSLSGLLTKLQGKRKQWRLVYWTLWTYCHFLFCSQCLQWFPVSEINSCRFHPENPHAQENARADNFTCCGRPHYRFTVVAKNSGCQFKLHTPVLSSTKEQTIFRIFQSHKNLSQLEGKNLIVSNDSIALLKPEGQSYCRNLVKEQYLPMRPRESKRKGWLKKNATAWNQDNQREQEERKIREIQNFLSGKDENKPSPQFRGGSYVNVETEWWSNLRSEMRNIIQE